MELSGHFHAPAALHSGKEAWRKEKFPVPVGNRNPVVQPVARSQDYKQGRNLTVEGGTGSSDGKPQQRWTRHSDIRVGLPFCLQYINIKVNDVWKTPYKVGSPCISALMIQIRSEKFMPMLRSTHFVSLSLLFSTLSPSILQVLSTVWLSFILHVTRNLPPK